MPVRSSMSQILARLRVMIADAAGPSQFFADQDMQDTCDEAVEFVRYEPLQIAPSIINTASTNNQATVIFIEYFSRFQWWEADAVVQGINIPTNAAWVVLAPSQVDYINGHVWFEAPSSQWSAPTAPGQYPPCFMTGKVYDLNMVAADLLEFWAAALSGAYDMTVDGQSLRRSQLMTAKLTLAEQYRRKARPRTAKLRRDDVNQETHGYRTRLLDERETVR